MAELAGLPIPMHQYLRKNQQRHTMQSMSSGRLALFDLDNTLLEGDSDHAWGEFLISKKLVDADTHRETNDYFYEQYKQGKLDIHGYVAFTPGACSSPRRQSSGNSYMRNSWRIL